MSAQGQRATSGCEGDEPGRATTRGARRTAQPAAARYMRGTSYPQVQALHLLGCLGGCDDYRPSKLHRHRLVMIWCLSNLLRRKPACCANRGCNCSRRRGLARADAAPAVEVPVSRDRPIQVSLLRSDEVAGFTVTICHS